MDDNTPETDTADRFAEIRQGLADLKTVKDGLIGTTGRYGWSYVDNTYRKNMVDDLHYLLAAVDRLRAAPRLRTDKAGRWEVTVEADRIEHVARTAWQTNADFGGHVGEMWRHQTPAVQERWRVIAQAVLDYVEPNEEVKRLESQMRGLRRAYDHACEQRDKYMRRTAEWRDAAMREDNEG